MKKKSKLLILACAIFIATSLICAVYAQTIIGSDYKASGRLRLSLVLYQDNNEKDPNYDYYLAKASVYDGYGYPISNAYASNLNLRMALPPNAEQVPTSGYSPKAGTQLSTNPVTISGGFSAYGVNAGISVSVKMPMQTIQFSTFNNGYLYADWTATRTPFGGSVIDGTVAEFAFSFRVPQGQAVHVWAGTSASWVVFATRYYAFPLLAFGSGSDSIFWAYA